MDEGRITLGEPRAPGDPEPRSFTVAKLRCGTLRRVSEIVAEIDGIDPKTRDAADLERWRDAHLRGICEVLRRNDPTITPRDIEDLVDADQIQKVFFDVLAAAGRKVKPEGEAVSP